MAEFVPCSILDDDLYKFTMQQAVFHHYDDAVAEYAFTNRNKNVKFNQEFLNILIENLNQFSTLKLTSQEKTYLKTLGYFSDKYLSFLESFRYDPSEVCVKLSPENDLEINIQGKWVNAIMWEVKLMALISEIYFQTIDTNWNMDGQDDLARSKGHKLHNLNVNWSDFGTRRRRCFKSQENIVKEMDFYTNSGFLGTSNVKLAMDYGINPCGTLAHEWVMGNSAIWGLSRANHFALEKWTEVYQGQLNIALPDTFGSEAFFKDFNSYYTRFLEGVRQDSGCFHKFTERSIEHYIRNKVNPKTKKVIYSDGLNLDNVEEINNKWKNEVHCVYGIGTNLTNDFAGSKPLNMVIKLRSLNGIPVVKLSDVPTKATGDPDAIRVAKWTFYGQPLDGEK